MADADREEREDRADGAGTPAVVTGPRAEGVGAPAERDGAPAKGAGAPAGGAGAPAEGAGARAGGAEVTKNETKGSNHAGKESRGITKADKSGRRRHRHRDIGDAPTRRHTLTVTLGPESGPDSDGWSRRHGHSAGGQRGTVKTPTHAIATGRRDREEACRAGSGQASSGRQSESRQKGRGGSTGA